MPKSIKRKNLKLQDLKFDPHNANRGTDRGRAMVGDSLAKYGAGRSVLAAKDGTLIAGNKTVEQAIKSGAVKRVREVHTKGDELVVVVRDDLAPESKKARGLALADNRAGQVGLEWDVDVLADLAANDAEALAGLFDERELRDLLGDKMPGGKEETADAGDVLVDRAEELQAKWGVVSGDVWQIADHFIICGDCREFGTWQKLLGAAKVERVNGAFTSPPYAEQRKKQYGGVETDKYVEWWNEVQANVRANLAPDGSFFVNIKPHCENGERVLYVFDLVLAMRRQWGWRYVDELCWERASIPGLMGDRFKNGFEPIYHFAVGACKFNPKNVLKTDTDLSKLVTYDETDGSVTMGKDYDGRSPKYRVKSKNFDGAMPSNVIRAATGFASEATGTHGASFPVALPEFFIKAYSDTGDVWFDPFLGSGTTIVAAYRNGRRGLGIEKLEKYVSVCLERLTVLGLEAKRVTDTNGNGKTKATA